MRWAYIYEHPGTDPTSDRTVVARDGVTSILVPVPDAAAVPGFARELAAEGVRLIELCGGLTPADAAAVRAAVGDSVAVGHVTFAMDSLAAAAAYAADFGEGTG